MGMFFAALEKWLCFPSQAPEAWWLFLLLVVILSTITCTLVNNWPGDQWACYLLAHSLTLYTLQQSGWQGVSSSIDTEFQKMDKFAIGAQGLELALPSPQQPFSEGLQQVVGVPVVGQGWG